MTVPNAAEIGVQELMTSDPVCVHPDTPIEDAVALMANHDVSSLPVVDGEGHLLGFLGNEDVIVEIARVPEPQFVELLGAYIEFPGTYRKFRKGMKKMAALTAGEAMDDDPSSIGVDESIEDAATLMVFHKMHHLAVIDGEGVVVGFLSRSDLVRWLATHQLGT
ncbi:MAG: CBS domain-containing protein [Acidimicrobiia bacterium]|nr:CBS domain-containing protein [Acidimicrobiia bacterium]